MLNNFNKFVASSISMAYLVILSWASAYAYGWGQAVYHGYPWWHVVQGGSMIARSLAFVCAMSLVLVVGYVIGYWVFKGIKRLFDRLRQSHTSHLGCVKIFILLVVLFTPIALLLYFYVGILSWVRLVWCVVVISSISLACHQLGKMVNLSIDLKGLTSNEKYYQIFMGFIFLYLIISAFVVGYLRSAFFVGYDMIKVDNQAYYILAINGDEDFILGKKMKHNECFVFFNRKTLNYYDVYITPSPYLPFRSAQSMVNDLPNAMNCQTQ